MAAPNPAAAVPSRGENALAAAAPHLVSRPPLPKAAGSDPARAEPRGLTVDDYPHPDENIFFFIPNQIGYVRVVLAIASLYYMPLHPRTCSFLYVVSELLDALDGHAARLYRQSTKFGAVLDMVTDRCATACMMVFLSSAFPRYSLFFQGLISLDFASHYTHMYATFVTSDNGDASHKDVDGEKSRILKLYYSNRTFLFTLCAGNELFWIALYLLSFSSPLLSPGLLQPGALPTDYQHSWSAGAMELARANKLDSTVPWILAAVSAPLMLLKQGINVVQLVKASRWIAERDMVKRRQDWLDEQTAGKKDS